MAATAASPATAVLGGVRFAGAGTLAHRTPSQLLFLSPHPSFSRAAIQLSDVQRFSSLKVKASSSEETTSSFETEEIIADLKQKWDSIENKSTVFLYGGGAIVSLWLSSILIGAINSVPLLPKLLELVGLGYTGWFVYRYLLFKSSRKELAEDIESLKKKVAGTE